MYLKFYGLREEPFGVTPDPRFLYLSPTYREAQATLHYGIRSGRGFTALVAQPGMGKTTLLFHLLEQYSGRARTAFIFLTQCDSREFLRYLMSELGTDTQDADFVRLQDQFAQLLLREAQAGRKVIAVIDEAQNLDVTVLETVRLLSDFETPRSKLLHIILTGQPELADKLAAPSLLQLRQRISHLVRLDPLSQAEVQQYIAHRLRLAGYSGAPLFTPEAQSLILERSQGVPRVINNLCFNALSLGCALAKRTIDASVLAEVSADLDFNALASGAQNLVSGVSHQPLAPPPPVPSQAADPVPQALPSERRDFAPPPAQPGPQAPLPAVAGSESGLPADLLPGPVLLPGPPLAAVAYHSDEPAPAEMGNLALQIEPAKMAAAQPSPATGNPAPLPANGSAPSVPVPTNGSTASPANQSEKEDPVVDVEALASDCALLGMEAPRRWQRPLASGMNPTLPPGASPRPLGAKPVNTPRVVRPATPIPPGNRSSARIQWIRSGHTPNGLPAARGAVRLQPNPAAILRKRSGQRSLYLAAAASGLLLLLLIWLLGASGPAAPPSPAATNVTPAAVSANSGTNAVVPPEDGGTDNPDHTSVLDVVEELPRPGEEASLQDTRPAVVMRGSRESQQLLRRVDPVYPAAARLNRIQGPVVLEASIGTHGFLRHIRVLRGNPLLADSVLDAVRGWRYQPRMVHGRPVETTTRIVINFQLVPGPRNSALNR